MSEETHKLYSWFKEADKYVQYATLYCLTGDLQPIRLTFNRKGTNGYSVVNITCYEPAAINASKYLQLFDFTPGTWLARIWPGGKLQLSRKLTAYQKMQLSVTLLDLIANPMLSAKIYGKYTRSCCFCNKPLISNASIERGYGKQCSKHWRAIIKGQSYTVGENAQLELELNHEH